MERDAMETDALLGPKHVTLRNLQTDDDDDEHLPPTSTSASVSFPPDSALSGVPSSASGSIPMVPLPSYGATSGRGLGLPPLEPRRIPDTVVPEYAIGIPRTHSFPDDIYSGPRFARFEFEETLRRRNGTSILSWLNAKREKLVLQVDGSDESEQDRDRIKKLKAQHLESFDYDFFESRVQMQHEHEATEEEVRALNLGRWIMTFLVGMCTALVACFIDDVSRKLGTIRTISMQHLVTKERDGDAPMGRGFLVYAAISVAYILVASYCVAILCPVAGGSGISEIKCTLNGIKIHRIVRLKTLFCKAFGILFSVAGGLPVGKEGPMIHTGAVVGAGLSQGKSSSCGFDTSWTKFRGFRNDKEKRDFISCGAAAGVAAAFGAPIGGVLFALEEGASFWHQNLTWRTFFCAMVSAFVINLFASYTQNQEMADEQKHGFFGMLGTQTGTFSFGNFRGTKSYEILDLFFFIVLGMLGGLFGAGFNQANKRLTIWRQRMVTIKWVKLFEALLVAFCMAAVSFWLPRFFGTCQKIDGPYSGSLIPLYCPDGYYNDMASLFTVSYSTSIKQLLHFTTPTSFSPTSLGVFFTVFYIFACWTYGISVPSGLFIPSLLSGTAFGRIFVLIVHKLGLPVGAPDGMFALIGAASMLGGMARMTISLTVIILECTGVIEWGLPIMVALMAARWVGNSFNEGLYDIHIHLKHLPFLEYDPPFYSRYLRVENIMAKPVITVNQIAKVGEIYDILLNCNHGGFPVIIPPHVPNGSEENFVRKPAKFAGIINRRHLCVLLQRKDFFIEKPTPYTRKPASDTTLLYNDQYALSFRDLESTYPRFPSIYDIKLDDEERDLWMDLTPYMNPTPNTVQDQTTVPRAFRIFRSLGLRHLVVLNRRNEVKGIITRKDLTPAHLKTCLEGLNETEKQRIRGYFMRGRSMSQHFDDVEKTLLSMVDNS